MIKRRFTPESWPDEIKAGQAVCEKRGKHRIVWANLPTFMACRGYYFCADCWFVPKQESQVRPLSLLEKIKRRLWARVAP
jgi:hypothetical protein